LSNPYHKAPRACRSLIPQYHQLGTLGGLLIISTVCPCRHVSGTLA
jgi:hypothetical protein